MAYDPTADTGFPGRPANTSPARLQLPYSTSEGDAPRIFWGTGTPEGSVTGEIGDLFLRTDGGTDTTLYVKESGSGNTGWVAK
ncbi:MAG: hypothetical protein AMS20_00035 [Gemmatimonas sp. SG8_28]|nr:MAG: hypothetical protein AMS20_00035 [Gemmatimonas sp. SG8_28]